MLNKTTIEQHLSKDLISQVEIQVFNTTSSTNDVAKNLELPEGKTTAIIVANHQSKGRGRLSRTFYSPESAGIYMTLLMPALPIEHLLLATPAAAVAAVKAINQLSDKEILIKWVNDLYHEEFKIGGILTEAVTDYRSGSITHLAIGIGINCIDSNMPEDNRNKIGSLASPDLDRNQLAAEIFNQLAQIFEEIKRSDTSFMDSYRSLSNILGKEIMVYKSNMNLEDGKKAVAADIDKHGNLVVRYEDGMVEYISSGEVSIRL